MKILSHYYRVYVPTQLLSQARPGSSSHNLQLLIDQLTTNNGGMTSHQATGVWFDDLGKPHHENITAITWWFSGFDIDSNNGAMIVRQDAARSLAMNDVVEAMFACGEKCVAVEYHNPHTPLRMELRVPE